MVQLKQKYVLSFIINIIYEKFIIEIRKYVFMHSYVNRQYFEAYSLYNTSLVAEIFLCKTTRCVVH